MFSFLPEILRTPLAFAVVLGVLVFIHELGHYLAARWVGVHVETFSIGFGQAIAQWTDSVGTVWKLGWIPLGGYVKLHGHAQDEQGASDAPLMPGKTFSEKSVARRAIVIAAGPIANFLLAMLLFAGLFAVVGQPLATPVVGEVLPDSAAARAGLMAGDTVVAIGSAPVARFEDIQRVVSVSAGVPLSVQIRRGGAVQTVTVTPDARDAGGVRVGVLGVRGGAVVYERLGLLQAIPAGAVKTWDVTVQTLVGVGQMLSGQRGADELGGPLRIAQMSGQVAQLGAAALVTFIAVLSVNLGLINLFPIPVLDGGHLVFYAIEAVLGRPLSDRAQGYGLRAGLALLVGLFIFATWNDLGHIGVFQWVARLVG